MHARVPKGQFVHFHAMTDSGEMETNSSHVKMKSGTDLSRLVSKLSAKLSMNCHFLMALTSAAAMSSNQNVDSSVIRTQ